MLRVIAVRPLEGWRLKITFENGTAGTVSLEDRLFGPMFEPFQDTDLFSKVFVDEFGAVCWPNGADLAPDALYERIRASADVAEPADATP